MLSTAPSRGAYLVTVSYWLVPSVQEDYETFKEHMEEKADRQDAISSTLEGAQVRLEDAEVNIAALTEELEHSTQETRVR